MGIIEVQFVVPDSIDDPFSYKQAMEDIDKDK